MCKSLTAIMASPINMDKYQAACLAISHDPISNKCLQLGAEKEGICAGKGFYPYMKCSDTGSSVIKIEMIETYF